MENGLPSNKIYSIYKDSKGFLWFTSDKGVARYNGIKFETFTTDDGLADNEVFFFLEDYYGRIWMSTYNGKLCYYKDGTFYTEKNDSALKLPFKEPYILDISLEKDSSITIFYNDRTKFINIKKNALKFIPIRGIEKYINISEFIAIKKQSDSVYKIVCKNDDAYFNIKTNKIIKTENKFDLKFNQKDNRIHHYLYTNNEIYTLDKNELFHFDNGFVKNFLYSVYSSVEHRFFMGTNHGLFIDNDYHLLESENISSINQDNDGGYWVSTLENGVFYLDKNFLSENTLRNTYKGFVKYSCHNKNSFFFTTNTDDFYKLNENQTKLIFDYKKYKQHNHLYPTLGTTLTSGYSIDDNNTYYNYYNDDEFIISDINTNKPSIKHRQNDFHEGVRYVFSCNGSNYVLKLPYLAKISNPESQNQQHITHIDTFYIRQWPFSITKSSDNTIWYSTKDNVYKIENDRPVPQLPFKNIVFKWFNIYDNYLVGCSIDNKLIICNNVNGQSYIDSVINQHCIWNKAYRLDTNHILISTDNVYRILTLYPSQNTPKYHLSALENPTVPKESESICSDYKTCYFFKNNTIFCFPVKNLLEKPQSPQVFFTTVKVGDKNYSVTKSIEIPYSESKNISIPFSVLSFSSKELIYEYSIANTDDIDNWRQLKGEEINLVDAKHGNYFIKVRAKSLTNNSNIATLEVTILKPFWAALWFIILCVLLLIAGILFVIYIGVKQTLKKKEVAHKSKMSSLKSEYKVQNALMNPHFVFNTLNNVQSLVNKDNKLASNEYLRIFADLIRQNMHNLSFELIPLQKELDLVENYLKIEKLRFKEWFNYSINIDKEVDAFEVLIPPLLIQPLVENSIKHGLLPLQSMNGIITIKVYEKEDRTIIEVIDNGVGIESSSKSGDKLHESYGLENIKKRIMQLSALYSLNITFEIKETKSSTHDTTGTIAVISITSNL